VPWRSELELVAECLPCGTRSPGPACGLDWTGEQSGAASSLASTAPTSRPSARPC